MNVPSKIIQVKRKGERTENWCTKDTYNDILDKGFKPECVPLNKRHPLQCNTDIGELVDGIRNVMKNKVNASPPRCLLIDFSSLLSTEAGSKNSFDLLIIALQAYVDNFVIKDDRYLDVVIITSDLQEYLKAAKLNEFINACTSKDVGLTVLSIGSDPTWKILNSSDRLREVPDILLPVTKEPLNDTEIEKKITNSIEQIHGHFEIQNGHNGDGDVHVSTVLSLLSCSARDIHLTYFQSLIRNELQCEDYSIFFFGLQGNKMEAFVHALVNNENDRWLKEHDISKVANKNVVIVCDILWNMYHLDNFIGNLKKNGAKDILLIGFGRYASFNTPPQCKVKSFLDIPCVEHKADANSCPACIQGSEVVEGNNIEDLLKKISKFDDYTFWELMASSPGFFRSGHWSSGRTGKHYLHIMDVVNVLSKHGYGVTRRVLNMLSNANIKISWFDTILCPDEPEAKRFAELIGEEIGTSNSIQIITIPREYFGKITGSSISGDLKRYLFGRYGEKVLERRNVLIVDQAAHHFVTLSALKYLAEYFGSKILAFVVFIDRMYPLDLKEVLPDSHYIPLYRWPWPPYKGDLCPCTQHYQS